jgi:threonine synthase
LIERASMLLEDYREFLPITANTPRLTLSEGHTPLLPVPKLAAAIGVHELYVKLESMNPTGSFKDRGMVMAVAKAVEAGSSCVICASTGNTSASAAAYAARAGIEAVVVVPSGKIALGKLAQALMYGARLLVIDGNFDDALRIVREISDSHPLTLVNSVNPYRIDGQATAAYEICDVLGRAPDGLCLPVGNAGNITAYWHGFTQYHRAGKISTLPRMLGFEAAGSAAIVQGAPIAYPETIATAIRIGNPASWCYALSARDESEGIIDAVTDAQILDSWRDLARMEGIFIEPASAAGVAGLRMLVQQQRVDPQGTYVAVLTGHGLKDPNTAVEQFAAPEPIPANMHAITKWLGLA